MQTPKPNPSHTPLFLSYLFLLPFLLLILSISSSFAQTNYANKVNPFIGTGGHGHTFPGPVVPFGMVQVGPDTRIDGSWDGCSGYHYSDSIIYGFSHTHLSGTGCSDFGDVMLMPMAGKASFEPKEYASKFKHQNEIAKAGYYKVNLSDDDIDVELSSSARVGFHQYTFNKSGTYQVILDLLHRDKLLDGEIKIVNDHCIEGYRKSEAWAKDQRVYFHIEFSKANQTHILYSAQDKIETGAAFEFKVKKGEKILVKVAISSVDMEGARKNMKAEIPHWNFEQTKKEAEILWNKELSKIEVSGGTPDQETIFYTALYHCFIHPSIANDVDGRYLGRDFKIYKAEGFNYYSVFSLWDTFRALHPLFNIVQRERNHDFIKTFIEQYKQVGRMPMWELGSNETDCMIGYHSVSVVADALAKGNDSFDANELIEACLGTAKNHVYGAPTMFKNGYLNVEDEHESVSKTLEYAFNSWCLNQIQGYFKPRAMIPLNNELPSNGWQAMFNTKNGFMQPRMNGGWYEPFNPKEVNNNYTEANAWQYSFFVPHDIPGLIAAMGGPEAFEKKLDELFETGSATSGRQQADISGLIGQYAHGNEPSHHMAYLYNFIGKPHKTQKRVQQIMKEMYHNNPDGLAGNEDCGQMSAWFVLSSMGFYPVTPGTQNYQLGSPLFNQVKFNFKNNQTILDYGRTAANQIYVLDAGKKQSMTSGNAINHFAMFPKAGEKGNPNAKGTNTVVSVNFKSSEKPYDLPSNSFLNSSDFISSPTTIIESKSKTFVDSLQVRIYLNQSLNEAANSNKPIYYRISEKDNNTWSKNILYTQAFYIHESCKIIAGTDPDWHDPAQDFRANARFYKRQNNWNITLGNEYNKQYTAGGAEGLIDGIYGDKDWRKGAWQGYQPSDFTAILDLKNPTEIISVFANFLQDQRSWILMPKLLEVYISNDGINFLPSGSIGHDIPADLDETVLKTLQVTFEKSVKTRYVKIVARNFGKLPSKHVSAGEDAFIFVDEIGVKY